MTMPRLLAVAAVVAAAACSHATAAPAVEGHDSRVPVGLVMPEPCQYEDAWPQELCRWDAQAMGNGVGDSFTAVRISDAEGGTYAFIYDKGVTEIYP